MLRIKVSGIERELNKVKKQIAVQTDVATVTNSLKLVEELKEATPVDTGEARDGWKLDKSINGYIIKNDVEHIGYLNQGSSEQAPAYFIESTILKNKNFKPKLPL